MRKPIGSTSGCIARSYPDRRGVTGRRSGGGGERADEGAALLAVEHAAGLLDEDLLAEVVRGAGHEALGQGAEPAGRAVAEHEAAGRFDLQHLEVERAG